MSALDNMPRPSAVERMVIDPLPMLATPVVRLNGVLWSDCVLCGCDVNACECDPDDYAAALMGRAA